MSLINETTFKTLQEVDTNFQLLVCNNQLSGINRTKTTVLGYINLKLRLHESQSEEMVPFAVVRDDHIPCCIGTICRGTRRSHTMLYSHGCKLLNN